MTSSGRTDTLRPRTGRWRRGLLAAGLMAAAAAALGTELDPAVQAAVTAAFPGSTIAEHRVGISSAIRAELGDAAAARLAPRWRWRYLTATHPTQGGVGLGAAWKTMGRHGPIHILVLTDPALAVISVTVLKHREQYGKAIARSRFLKQFRGAALGEHAGLNRDVDGITGATVSSRAVVQGVRHCLTYLHKFAPPL